jgi:uncharacterized protein with FMN-binding domain
MKRALLIAGGTVGGLGAVLAITPPQLGSTSAINIAGAPIAGADTTASASASSSSSATSAATTKATAAKSSKPVATKNAGATKTPASGNSAASNSATPTAAATTAPATPAAINGTFTGPSVNVNYGNVQVKITVVNGRITDAVAVKAPTGKNDRYTNMAVPVLKQQTLKAQSANIQGVSGASYTSYGWYTSLQGAIALAGL